MKSILRYAGYSFFFLLCALLTPYFFKQHPFLTLSCLLVLMILVMRRDFMEVIK